MASSPFDPLSKAPSSTPADETRMRLALGLDRPQSSRPAQIQPEQARARRRFVRDGEVAVTVVSAQRQDAAEGSARDQLAAAEQALAAERAAHAQTTRSLQEALANVRSLQTKLAHAELAHGEAIAHERRAHAEAIAQERSAHAEVIAQERDAHADAIARERSVHAEAIAQERSAREQTEAALRELRAAADGGGRPGKRETRNTEAIATRSATRGPKVTRAKPQKEPEPVKWWLPSDRKAKGRR